MVMKAYHVYDVNMDWESQEIVFAETPGKAKLQSEVAGFYDFTEIRAKRKPEFDKYAEQGYVPKQALLEDGWWFECRAGICQRRLTIDDDPVIVGERVYCAEHAPLIEGSVQ